MKYCLLESHKKQHRETLTTKAKQRKAKQSNSFMFYSINIAFYKLIFSPGIVFHK